VRQAGDLPDSVGERAFAVLGHETLCQCASLGAPSQLCQRLNLEHSGFRTKDAGGVPILVLAQNSQRPVGGTRRYGVSSGID
jgi:hypothetical protein